MENVRYTPMVVIALAAAPLQPPPPVSFRKQVLPLLVRECRSCHGGMSPASGWSVESREALFRGGRRGAAVLPRKGAQSPLVRFLTGDAQPKMPPGPRGIDLDTIALVRRWIDEGARVDGFSVEAPASLKPVLPLAAPAASVRVPLAAAAFSPDGKRLAVGGGRRVRLLDPATGALEAALSGVGDQVQAVAFSPDGRWLAIGGGVPGERGDIAVYEIAGRRRVRTLGGHAEPVMALAWRPGGAELVSASLDKTMRVWDAATGALRQTLTDHADGVLSVAFSPDGRRLASGSLDRSVKLFDPTAGYRRLGTLTAHDDGVAAVAFRSDGALLASAGLDKTVRVWDFAGGALPGNPLRSQSVDAPVWALAFGKDALACGLGESRRVRIFNGTGERHLRDLNDLPDWVVALAFGADGTTLAAGILSGETMVWDDLGQRPPRKAAP